MRGGGGDSEGVTGGVEAAVAVLFRLALGKRGVHAAWTGPAMGWGRQAVVVCFSRVSELITQVMSSISLSDCCMRRVVWTYTLHLR